MYLLKTSQFVVAVLLQLSVVSVFWDQGECFHSLTLPEYQSMVVLPGDSDGSTCPRETTTALEGLQNDTRAIIRDKVLSRFCNLIESYNLPQYFWGIQNVSELYIMNEDMVAAQYVLAQPGLSGDDGTVSFQSCADPTKYLKPDFFSNSEIIEITIDDTVSPTTLLEATFYRRKDFFFAGFDSFESFVIAGHFIRHALQRLRLDEQNSADDLELFMNDASFRILPQALHY